MNKILIGIPCYNCSSQILRVITSLSKLDVKDDVHYLFIDNRSTDNTLQVIADNVQNLNQSTVVQNLLNYGLGGSQKIIFNYAIEKSFDALIVLHGDDQASCDDIALLTKEYSLSKKHYLGSRFMLKSKRQGYQLSRVIGNMGLNIIFTIFTKRLIKDLGSGINLFDVAQLRQVSFKNLSNQFNFNVDLLLSFISLKQSFKFIPILWREIDQASNARNLKVAFSMLRSLFYWLVKSSRDQDVFNSEYLIIGDKK